MDRREFVATSALGALGAGRGAGVPAPRSRRPPRPGVELGRASAQEIRSAFPRAMREVYVNGAGGAPLGVFAEQAIERYVDFARLGPAEGRGDYYGEVLGGVRGRFADLVGVRESEIGLVHCTKAGEQILLDHLTGLREGGNIVTNDLHFSGSLHNLEGMRRAGRDVRVVRSSDLDVPFERMADAIDARTALVTVSLISNVNGRVEPMAELARVAHERGAVVFADIIQAAGAVPIDLPTLGVDAAACSSYKWLFGIHGAGFLYLSEALQGSSRLPDHLFPGHVRRNYPPFVPEVAAGEGAFTYTAPSDARRYQAGHVSYLGYAAVYEGLGFLNEIGVARVQEHAVRLNRHLLDQLDPDDFRLLSTHVDTAPILSLEAQRFDGLFERLVASDVVIGIGGDKWNQVRISPAIYNTEADMDRVAEVLVG